MHDGREAAPAAKGLVSRAPLGAQGQAIATREVLRQVAADPGARTRSSKGAIGVLVATSQLNGPVLTTSKVSAPSCAARDRDVVDGRVGIGIGVRARRRVTDRRRVPGRMIDI